MDSSKNYCITKDSINLVILIQVFIKGSEPVYIGLDFQDRIRKASERSANPFGFVNRCCTITCGSLVLTILLSLILAIPIAEIVIGSVFLKNCTIQPKIPIWLIVCGSIGCLTILVKISANIFSARKRSEEGKIGEHRCLKYISFFLAMVFLVIFIFGNVWVFSVKDRVNHTDLYSLNYCHQTLYLFAFWIIIAAYIILGIMISIVCFFVLFAACCMGLKMCCH